MDLIDHWLDVCNKHLSSEPDLYIQIRKMFKEVSFRVPWKDFNSGDLLSFQQMGYKNEKSKMKQLERNYFNEEEFDRIRDTFLFRFNDKGNKSLQTCVTARMGNKKKDSRSQGFCMQSLTINHLKIDDKDVITLSLHYRSTELLQKFMADLVFLRDRVFPYIMEGWPEGLEPVDVKFDFSVMYISLMFMPVLYQAADVPQLLMNMKEDDPRYYRTVISAMSRLMVEECSYNYRTRANMHQLFWDEVHGGLSKKNIKVINRLIKEFKNDSS